MVACLPRHGVAYRLGLGYTLTNLHQRVLCHHAFVHAVEGQPFTIRAPEDPVVAPKLVAVHSPPIHYPHGGISRYHAPHPLAVYELYALPNIVLQPLLLGRGIRPAGLCSYGSG